MNWNFINTMPSVNFKIFISVSLSVLYVLAVCICLLLGIVIPLDIVEWVGEFLLLMMGIDGAVFVGKRLTDVDYATAKAGDPTPAPVPPLPAAPAAPAPPMPQVVP